MRLADYESLIAEFSLRSELSAREEMTVGSSHGQTLADDDRSLLEARVTTVMENLQAEIAKTSQLTTAHQRLLTHAQELQTRCNSLEQELGALR
eukprot:630990-Amphidinium_carterae.1